jgi:hypothetical protein
VAREEKSALSTAADDTGNLTGIVDPLSVRAGWAGCLMVIKAARGEKNAT